MRCEQLLKILNEYNGYVTTSGSGVCGLCKSFSSPVRPSFKLDALSVPQRLCILCFWSPRVLSNLDRNSTLQRDRSFVCGIVSWRLWTPSHSNSLAGSIAWSNTPIMPHTLSRTSDVSIMAAVFISNPMKPSGLRSIDDERLVTIL